MLSLPDLETGLPFPVAPAAPLADSGDLLASAEDDLLLAPDLEVDREDCSRGLGSVILLLIMSSAGRPAR